MFNASIFKVKLEKAILIMSMGLILTACGGGSDGGSSDQGSVVEESNKGLANTEVVVVDEEEEQSVVQEDVEPVEVIVIPEAPVVEEDSVDDSSTSEETEVVTEVVVVDLVISNHPQAVATTEGEQATFSVEATGSGSLSYVWRKDGNVIEGQTLSVLTLGVTSSEDTGVYDVVVTDDNGSLTSNAALLVVEALVEEEIVEEVVEEVVEEEIVEETVEKETRSLEISWDIPTSREDDSALELFEIDSYVVVYGTDSENLSSKVVVDGAIETSVTIDDLDEGTYYFAIATVDLGGNQSDFSSVIEHAIL